MAESAHAGTEPPGLPDAGQQQQQQDGEDGEEELQRDWDGLHPELLYLIFDKLLTCPSAHPRYLPQKARRWGTLSMVCRSWRAAVHKTPVGVCLPASVEPRMHEWLCKVGQRALGHTPRADRCLGLVL